MSSALTKRRLLFSAINLCSDGDQLVAVEVIAVIIFCFLEYLSLRHAGECFPHSEVSPDFLFLSALSLSLL